MTTTQTHAAQVLTDAETDQHLDAVLNGAGSALRHYTTEFSLSRMRAAMREHEAAILAKLQPAQAGELPDEREAFEAWYADAIWEEEAYRQSLYRAWQARAALAARKPLTDETFVAACNGCPTPGKCKDTSGCASAGMNVPTYYVRHPDDTYTAADPQPRFNGIGLEVKP